MRYSDPLNTVAEPVLSIPPVVIKEHKQARVLVLLVSSLLLGHLFGLLLLRSEEVAQPCQAIARDD